ncbi:hypothetical protein MYK68_20545 [Gordonia sp. PP30]|uniref:hypothetical protein n=1 Tax=unclassified Gordonia (in: high G+C Gram-positive bacteria) TaxID=2657482 RepID=UPI001FFED817|nr:MULTISPECIES: hypothetical protein [unclassified Gordonia (in: high G+C Gram-positive bacteria)]UQE75045.1 hypothetical protein MYK68_20545 [Gordonia sp. PP30]
MTENGSGGSATALAPAKTAAKHKSKPPVGKAVRAAIVVTAAAVVMNLLLDVGTSGF